MAARIALATFGSFGDLHPYLSIARELKRRGHHPIIATVAMYKDKVEAAGFEFRLLRTALVERPDGELMQKVLDLRNGAEFIIRKLIVPALPVAYSDARSALEGVSLVVVHPLVFGARLAAEAMKIPWVCTQLAPLGFLSAYDPPVIPVCSLSNALTSAWPSVLPPGFRAGEALCTLLDRAIPTAPFRTWITARWRPHVRWRVLARSRARAVLQDPGRQDA